ncbi:MAG: hypothetical protein WCJ62_10905, partial [Flavobacterium sp.]
IVQQLHYNHDQVIHTFDAYWDSNNWVSTSSNGNVQIQKSEGRYMIHTSCNNLVGSVMDNEWRNALTINSNSYIGIGTSNVDHRISIQAEDSSPDGPHIVIRTDTDQWPLFQQLNYTHDHISQTFDAFYQSNVWLSSDSNANFSMQKHHGRLSFVTSCNNALGSSNITWRTALSLNSNSFVTIGDSNPSTDRITIRAEDSSPFGPHMSIFTYTDSNHPLFQQLNYSHDQICQSYDTYFQSNVWKSSSSTGNFLTQKHDGRLIFQTSCNNTEGQSVDWRPAFTINSNSFIGIGTSNILKTRVTVTAEGSSMLGPHVSYFIDTDSNCPVFQQLNWTHDQIHMGFDTYFNGSTWQSSSTNGNFLLSKQLGSLVFSTSCNAPMGSDLSLTQAFSININSFIGIKTTNPTHRLTVRGEDQDMLGPHAAYYVSSDSNYPVVQQLNWSKDKASTSYNSYWNGSTWISCSNNANFKFQYDSTKFNISSCCNISTGSAIPWYNALTIDSNSYIGIGCSNTTNRLTVAGPSNSMFGPHVAFYFLEDVSMPTFQIYNSNHDNVSLNFDAFWDGASWISSSTTSAFQIAKQDSRLLFKSVDNSQSNDIITWKIPICINSNSFVSINNSNPTLPLDVAGGVLLRSNLYVNRHVTISNNLSNLGNASFSSNVLINSNLYVDQNTVLSNTLSNLGNASFSSNVLVNSNLYVNQNTVLSNTLSNLGDASFSSNLLVNSNLYVNQNTVLSNTLSNLGNASFSSNVLINSNLYVNQNTVLSNTLSNLGNASFSSNVLINSNLYVNQNTVLSNTLSNLGNASFSSNVLVNSNLYVNQNTVLSNTLSNLGNASFSSNVLVNSNLYVNQNTVLSNTLSNLGNASFSSNVLVNSNLYVNQNTVLSNTLSNLGNASFSSNVLVNSNLYVNQNTVLSNTLSNLGNASFSSNVLVNSNLYVNQNTVLSNTLSNLGNASFSSNVLVNSNLYVNQNTVLSNTLSNLGNASFSSNVLVNSNLYVNQNTVLSNTLNTLGNTTFASNVVVGSNLYINQNVTISNSLTNLGNANFASNVVVQSNLTVNSSAIFLSNVYITGQLTTGSLNTASNVGTPNFTGDVVFTSNMTTVGFTTLCNSLSNFGNVYFNSNLVIKQTLSNLGNAYFASNVTIKGQLSVDNINYTTSNVTIVSSTTIQSNLYLQSNLGIGTSNPIAQLDLRLYTDGVGKTLANFGNSNNGDVYFRIIDEDNTSNIVAYIYAPNATFSNTLSNLGNASFSSNVFINSNLFVKQNATFSNTLSNLGNASFSSNVLI